MVAESDEERTGGDKMTAKPEPLTKEKIRTVFLDSLSISHEAVFSEDVKSAVQWLLKEVEKKKQQILKRESIRGHEIYLAWLGWFESLIQKAFEGVVE